MNENKILEINTEINQNKESVQKKTCSIDLQTNPIIKKMLFFNLNNKKGKFKFKDLFR